MNWTAVAVAVAVEDTGAVAAVAECCRRASRGPGGLLHERHGKPSRTMLMDVTTVIPVAVDGVSNLIPLAYLFVSRELGISQGGLGVRTWSQSACSCWLLFPNTEAMHEANCSMSAIGSHGGIQTRAS